MPAITPRPPAFPRVTKTLRPPQHGTLKLLRRYGDALLYVRYREDGHGRRRCTTIEIVIDEGPVQRRLSDRSIVYFAMSRADEAFRHRAWRMGARWSAAHRAWRMSYRAAKALGIADQVSTTWPILSSNG